MNRCIHCRGLISDKEKAAARALADSLDETYVPPSACDDCMADMHEALTLLHSAKGRDE